MRSEFSGRVAAITGGASGIGLACAEKLAGRGAQVVLWDNSGAALQAASARFSSGQVTTRVLDVTDPDDLSSAAAEVVGTLGKIDILISSAGITGPTGPAWTYPRESWRKVIEINLDGVFHACAAVVPYMRQAGYGRIVNVASIGGKEGNANASAYAASKGGVIAFTKALGKELVDVDVRANCICPAAIETELLKQMDDEFVAGLISKIPMGRLGTAEEVASLIVWLASSECSFCTGAVFDCSGGRATY